MAINYLENLGYKVDKPIFDPLQNVNLMMAWHDQMPAVEIIYPSESKGPLESIIGRRPEGLVYHLCYQSDNLQKSLSSIEDAGLRVFEISPIKPAVLFNNKPVSFYTVAGVGLIEIIGE